MHMPDMPDVALPFDYSLFHSRAEEEGLDLCDPSTVTLSLVGDVLKDAAFQNRKSPATVLVDAAYIQWGPGTTARKEKMAKTLCVCLNAAANGRIYFISRQYVRVREEESRLKSGQPSSGANTEVSPAFANFRLSGRVELIKAPEKHGVKTGCALALELVDIKSGAAVWSNRYETPIPSSAEPSGQP